MFHFHELVANCDHILTYSSFVERIINSAEKFQDRPMSCMNQLSDIRFIEISPSLFTLT